MSQIAFMGQPSYQERKREKDRVVMAQMRIIRKDQPSLTQHEAYQMSLALYEQDQTYTPINTTIESTAALDLHNNELEMQTTTGPRTIGTSIIEQTPQHKPIRNINGVQLTDEQRTAAKAIILDVMSRVWIIKTACAEAGVSRDTYQYWCSVCYITADELSDAYARYQDNIREELTKLGFVGEGQPLVHNGRIVHNKAGQRELIYKKNVNILLRMAAKHLPEFADQPKQVEITHHSNGDIPSAYELCIDTRLLNQQEFATLKSIAASIDARRGIIDSQPL